jgi:lipid II:glycine glycyltransferase (peptidoglycan interpeptide bridge formation enzyme)
MALSFHTRSGLDDADWDRFLFNCSGDHHLQSCAWARSILGSNWRVERLWIRQSGKILAGGQIIFRSYGPGKDVGYITRGPVIESDDWGLRRMTWCGLADLSHRLGNRLLAIQPPISEARYLDQLEKLGFSKSKLKMELTATVLIDLKLEVAELLKKMSRRTRYNVNLGDRKNIAVYEGGLNDLGTFDQLANATSKRQNFELPHEGFSRRLWDAFDAYGRAKLFLAKIQEEVLSAILVLVSGNTVINTLSVWTGTHGECKPNEALQWHVIRWAKAKGYRYYDLNGIEPAALEGLKSSGTISTEFRQSMTSFKLGFGGEAIELPGVYEHVF